METKVKAEIINDLANNIPQSEIAKKHDCTQQNISYLLKVNKYEVEKLKSKLISRLSTSMVNRAVKESRKADKIVDHYDNDTLEIPDKEQAEYLKQHDSKVAGLLKGIIAPQTSDTNINVTKNEQNVTAINSDVLKMFHKGAKGLLKEATEIAEETM